MKRFTGHGEPWGDFVDVKINAPQVLRRQLRRCRRGSVLLSSVTDPYQPLEKKYLLTRGCLEALLESQFPISLLTRSPLCLRALDLLKQFKEIEVGFSIGTDDEGTRRIFEPHSPSIPSRIEALKTLHQEGVPTYAFIGPMLPLDPKRLPALLEGKVDEVLIDRMNYPNRVKALYRRANLDPYLEDDYFQLYGRELKGYFEQRGISVSMCF
jgi:DNA repair photolyase